MSRAKAIVGVLLIGAVAAVMLWVQPPPSEPSPIAEATSVSMRGYEADGRLSWEVKADRGTVLDEEGSLDDVSLSLYPDTDSALTVRADRLVRQGDDAIMTGGITVSRSDGLALETEQLAWDASRQQLRAGETWLRYHADTLRGLRFEYDLAAGNATLSDATAALLRDGEEIRVSSARATITDSDIVLQDDVRVGTAAETIEGQILRADLDAEKVEMEGEIRGEAAGLRFQADQLVWSEDGLTAYGQVKVEVDLEALSNHGT